ncbi:MAG: hypothetical protein SWN98_04080 [Pseudomonadota bacterium]|jgi:hypothetical protein|nr:hypothetical protein [Pseudomonadota bacterium]
MLKNTFASAIAVLTIAPAAAFAATEYVCPEGTVLEGTQCMPTGSVRLEVLKRDGDTIVTDGYAILEEPRELGLEPNSFLVEINGTEVVVMDHQAFQTLGLDKEINAPSQQ